MSRRKAAAVLAALAMIVPLVMAPSWLRPGSPFDEGFALAYPVRVLEGAVPHRDFISFYGPGNPWLLAGAFAVAGDYQDVERAVGLFFRILIVVGVAALTLPWGRLAALSAGGLALLVLVPSGVTAFAPFAALGLALTSIMALTRGPVFVAGLLAGFCGLARLDFGLVAVLASVPILARLTPQERRVYAGGLAPAALAYAVHAAIVGPDRVGGILSDLVASGPGRRLPFDLLASEGARAGPARLLVLLITSAAVGLVVALRARHEPDPDERHRALACLGLLALGLVPYALFRLDYLHVAVPLVPALAVVPLVFARAGWGAPALAAAAVAAVALLAAPVPLRADAAAHARILLGRSDPYGWSEVSVGGRSFGLAPEVASDARRIVAAALREQRAGARTLFVGPRDLRRTNANDVYFYYLLRDLEPASYYMELNPQTANRAGSGLADDLRRADLVILNRAWDYFDEPNESALFGPTEPNRVLAERFCSVLRAGTLELRRRCA